MSDDAQGGVTVLPEYPLQYLMIAPDHVDEARRIFVTSLFNHGDGFDLKGWRAGFREIEAYLRDGSTPTENRGKITLVKP